MRTFVTTALAACVVANNTPIYGTYPGWVEGERKAGIDVELFFDFMCSACKAENPIWEETLTQPWLGSTVADQLGVAMTPFPLPYHVHAWQVGQLVPYFQDLCTDDATQCALQDQYKDFSFSMQDTILGMTSTSQKDFETWWSGQVATEFGFKEATIARLYGVVDVHNTSWRIREMWKYATAKGVNATPTVFINGAHLDVVPFSVDDWMTLLNQIYDSQWHAPSSKPEPVNDACPLVEGSMSFWCQDTSSCIAGFPTSYTCDGGQVCCEHYCMEGENGCLQEEEEEPANDACPLVEGSMSFWCQDTSSCIAGFPTSYTCDNGQVCCEHYCMEGENGCLDSFLQ